MSVISLYPSESPAQLSVACGWQCQVGFGPVLAPSRTWLWAPAGPCYQLLWLYLVSEQRASGRIRDVLELRRGCVCVCDMQAIYLTLLA